MTELQRNYADLTQSQKRIAEAIVENPEFVAFATVDKLSARLGIASSIIVRFGGADEGAGDDNAVAHLGQGTAAASLRHDLDNLRHTIADLDGATIEKAIGLLTAAPRVFFTGGLASKAL